MLISSVHYNHHLYQNSKWYLQLLSKYEILKVILNRSSECKMYIRPIVKYVTLCEMISNLITQLPKLFSRKKSLHQSMAGNYLTGWRFSFV